MFFCLPYEYEPAGLFTLSHLLLFTVTGLLIGGGLYASRHMSHKNVRKTIRIVTLTLWILEILKIIFVLRVTGSRNPNDFIPLYYCSLILYAGVLSSFCEGLLRRVGDCFIATGSLVGGLCFLVFPNTSLPRYPLFHFISFHSFLLHGLMVYLGLLLLLRGYYKLRMKDIRYPVALVSIICAIAFIYNTLYDRLKGVSEANLMFISKDFPGTPVSVLYHLFGPLFPFVMWLIQAFGPFLLVYGGAFAIRKIREKRMTNSEI